MQPNAEKRDKYRGFGGFESHRRHKNREPALIAVFPFFLLFKGFSERQRFGTNVENLTLMSYFWFSMQPKCNQDLEQSREMIGQLLLLLLFHV